MRPRIGIGALLGMALLVAGCGEEQPPASPARRDYQMFRSQVYEVLLRDCGFPDCHGAPERFFRVYGPGRTRLPLETTGLPLEALDLPSGDELSSSWQLAMSMIDTNDPARSLLLLKPLAEEAGGANHMGTDNFGRNVYRTSQDAGYIAIARWVFSPPPATPPAPTLP